MLVSGYMLTPLTGKINLTALGYATVFATVFVQFLNMLTTPSPYLCKYLLKCMEMADLPPAADEPKLVKAVLASVLLLLGCILVQPILEDTDVLKQRQQAGKEVDVPHA